MQKTFAREVVMPRRTRRQKSNNSNNENICRKLFDIVYPIEHQIYMLDIGGKIVLQPGLAGLGAAGQCLEEILFCIGPST
jgi:hypothetical protein